jgi:hypothetical protein
MLKKGKKDKSPLKKGKEIICRIFMSVTNAFPPEALEGLRRPALVRHFSLCRSSPVPSPPFPFLHFPALPVLPLISWPILRSGRALA